MSFIAINERGDEHRHYLTNKVSFPVLQDTKRLNIWSNLGGGKDEFFVYDKCGRFAAHLKSPEMIKFPKYLL